LAVWLNLSVALPDAVEPVPATGVNVALKVTITGVGVELLSSLLEQENPIKNKNKIAEKLSKDFIIIYFRVKKIEYKIIY
jgi:hypothetical protein